MSSCIKQICLVRTTIAALCVVSVFAIASCASQSGGKSSTVNYELAKVYLVQQGPTPGQSGDFWNGLSGTTVSRYPWIGGPSDANGLFFLAADAKRLYLRAEIKDSAPQLRPLDMDPGDAWNGTSLQVFFGTRLNRHSEYEEGDFGLAFWVVQEDPRNPNSLKLMVAKGRLLNERQYQSAVVEWKKDSYIIEASFSLDSLGITKPFKEGQGVRCEFRINHAKMKEDRSVIVNWRTSTDDAWRNPTTWSDGIVVKK
jgi:hypothetical protein